MGVTLEDVLRDAEDLDWSATLFLAAPPWTPRTEALVASTDDLAPDEDPQEAVEKGFDELTERYRA